MRNSKVLRVVLLLALVPGIAGAQTVYKCVAKGKPTTFQTEPCGAGQKQARAVSYTPDAVSTYRPDTRARPYARQSAAGPVAVIPKMAVPSACEAARQQRDIILGRNNQGGNYEVRVQLNDMVQRACN